jgi:class 3 adenylate cyclase
MFVDIRDFTPFAEANTAEDTVARLNALFDGRRRRSAATG